MKRTIRNYNYGTWGYLLFYHGKKEEWFSINPKESQEQVNSLLQYHKNIININKDI